MIDHVESAMKNAMRLSLRPILILLAFHALLLLRFLLLLALVLVFLPAFVAHGMILFFCRLS
jgi:hypothetical protein